MELGISMFADIHFNSSTGKFEPAAQRLKELIEEIRLADEVGLDVFGIGEHHREDYAVSCPEIVLAAAATVTKQIKLTSAVTVLSSADPVAIYQAFSTVDLLSGNRAEIMAGRGSFIESFPLFGYDLDDYNALFEEKLHLLLKIKEEKTVNWSGKFRAPLSNQQVNPRTDPDSMPVWVASGGTPDSVVRAAELGLPLVMAIIGGNPAQFAPLFNLYRKTYKEAGNDPAECRVGTHSHTFIGENSREIADYYFPFYKAQMDRIGRDRHWPPFAKNQYDYGRERNGALFIGEPAEVVDKILFHQEMFGLTRFLAHMDVGAPPHAAIMKSIELLGTKVAPEVRKALGD